MKIVERFRKLGETIRNAYCENYVTELLRQSPSLDPPSYKRVVLMTLLQLKNRGVYTGDVEPAARRIAETECEE